MKINQKIIFILLGIFLFIGCEKKEYFKEGTPVKIWIPGDRNEYSFYYEMFDRYKEKMESEGKSFDFVIEQQPWGDYWTKLPLEVNKGRGPDLYLAHVAYIDVLSAISKELDLDKKMLDKNFNIWDLYLGKNNKPQFIPTVFVSKVMYVNKDLWEKQFGKGNKNYPKTWKELEEISLKLKKPGRIGFDFSYHIMWDLGYQNGELITTEDGKLNLSKIGLNIIDEWEKKGVSDYLSYGNGSSESSFLEEASVIIYGEPWMEGWMKSSSDINFEAFPVPGETSVRTNSSAEISFGINKNVEGKRYKELLDFIEFMITDKETMEKIARGSAGISNHKGLAIEMEYPEGSAGNVVKKEFLSYTSVVSIPPSELEETFRNMLGNYLASNTTIEYEIKEAYLLSERVKLKRLKAMEDKFRDRVKRDFKKNKGDSL
jgi:multiple sugar transport system substrate-binding protein